MPTSEPVNICLSVCLAIVGLGVLAFGLGYRIVVKKRDEKGS